jgi:hypothetical protein
VTNREQAGRFSPAPAGADIDTLREINTPDAVSCRNDDPPDIVRL